MRSKHFFLRSRISSFGFAFRGLVSFFQEEPNARIHLAFTIGVIAMSVYFKLSAAEMIALTIAIAMVWVAEIFNTAIERVMDFISMEKNPNIKFIKDLAACGVLLSAIAALITGLLIFLPKII